MDSNIELPSIDLSDINAVSILDSIPDGVYITDKNRRILSWNKAAEEITGWQCKDVQGKCCHANILCHVDKDGHLLCGHEHCPLYRAMVTDTHSIEPHLIYGQRKDGRRIPLEVMVSPIHDENKNVIGGIEVFRDLSPAFQDFNRARIIQRESMGIRIPVDPRVDINVSYTPHDQVGGDFYQVEELNGYHYAFLIADVVGHGVSAALYAMQLRSLWEDGRDYLFDPEAFLSWLNGRVETLTDTDAGYFATAIHAVYDKVTGQLMIGSAGHPPPVIIRANGTVTPTVVKGPGLGLLPKPSYTIANTRIEPGDSLLLFTDGAFEVTNAKGEELGSAQFFEILENVDLALGAKALALIEEELLRYSNSLTLPDDLTMILLRRKL